MEDEKGKDLVLERVTRILLANLGGSIFPPKGLEAGISAAIYLGYCFQLSPELDQWLIRFMNAQDEMPEDEGEAGPLVTGLYDSIVTATGGRLSYSLITKAKESLAVLELLRQAEEAESEDLFGTKDDTARRRGFENFIFNLDGAIYRQVKEDPSISHMKLWHKSAFGGDFGPDENPVITSIIRQGEDWLEHGRKHGRVEALEQVLEACLSVLRARFKPSSYLGPILAERVLGLLSDLASDKSLPADTYEWWPKKTSSFQRVQGKSNWKRGEWTLLPNDAMYRCLHILWLKEHGLGHSELGERFYPSRLLRDRRVRISQDLGVARKSLEPAMEQPDLIQPSLWLLRFFSEELQRIRSSCLSLVEGKS